MQSNQPMMLLVLSADRRRPGEPPASDGKFNPTHPVPQPPASAPSRQEEWERGANKVHRQEGGLKKKSNLPAHRSGSGGRYYSQLSVAVSAAAHSELLAAEREFRRRDLFTWSRPVLLIGGEAWDAARQHLYGEGAVGWGEGGGEKDDNTGA